MTTESKITLLKTMLDDSTPDDVLNAYLELAGQKILNRLYPYRADTEALEIPDRYAMTQINVAVYLINKRGAEGQIQHIENGIHRNYGDSDVPDSMLSEIVPFCRAIR